MKMMKYAYCTYPNFFQPQGDPDAVGVVWDTIVGHVHLKIKQQF